EPGLRGEYVEPHPRIQGLNAYTAPSPATKIRPLAAMGVLKRWSGPITSPLPPPANTTAPVSPSNPRSRPSPPAPPPHTIDSACPSVVVTIGDPDPFCDAHHATSSEGGDPGLTRIAPRSPSPSGQIVLPEWKITYVASLLV